MNFLIQKSSLKNFFFPTEFENVLKGFIHWIGENFRGEINKLLGVQDEKGWNNLPFDV